MQSRNVELGITGKGPLARWHKGKVQSKNIPSMQKEKKGAYHVPGGLLNRGQGRRKREVEKQLLYREIVLACNFRRTSVYGHTGDR